jgi:hypothetical protein
VGSLRFDGVRFVAYPQDHEPRHVHGFYAETEVIVDLLPGPLGGTDKANRRDAVRPGNAKRSDVKYILQVASAHFDEIVSLWEEAHA